MSCAGIHTMCIEPLPILYVCTSCGSSGLSKASPTPKLCADCAERQELCRQCARKLDKSE